MKNYFASNLKLMREKAGISQTEFGKLFNVKPSTIAGWESEYRSPKTSVAYQIAQYFGVPFDQFVSEDLSLASVDIVLNNEEKDLIIDFRKLDQKSKYAVQNMIQALLK